MNTEISNKWMVCVRCYTYNQSRYITDALNGFVMQQTNFPFVCCIVDDASTDGEQAVIREYMCANFDLQDVSVAYEKDMDYGHLTFAQHKANQNCFFAVVYLKENHHSQKKLKSPYISEWIGNAKYIALCEGDDYWTDPMKLQKQVDFLEVHPDYSLCCHICKIYNQNEGTWEDDYVKKLFDETPNGFSFGNKENFNTWMTKTLTLMYRRDCYDGFELLKYRYRCDVHNSYHLLKKGRGFCMPFIGAVYRRNDLGVYSGLSEKEKIVRWCRIRAEFLNYNLEDGDLRDIVFKQTRKYLYRHDICKELLWVILVCLKSFYFTDGFWEMMRAMKKMVGSYWHGLGSKH